MGRAAIVKELDMPVFDANSLQKRYRDKSGTIYRLTGIFLASPVIILREEGKGPQDDITLGGNGITAQELEELPDDAPPICEQR